MNAAERSLDASGTPRDQAPPRVLVTQQDDHGGVDAERLSAAVAALERVRTQLARTQRTLDAFVAQITGTPDGAQHPAALTPAPEPLPEPATAGTPVVVGADMPRREPPDVLAGHVLPPAELQPPPAPMVPRAPIAPTVPAAPAAEATVPRPAPPGALAGHVHAPGDRSAPTAGVRADPTPEADGAR